MKRTVAIALGLGAALVGVVMLVMWLLRRPEAEFPAWLEATATLAAFVAAAIAVRYASNAYQLEYQREERWQDAQSRVQASLVAAWAEVRPTWGRQGKSSSFPDVGCWIRNASELPITNVTMEAQIHEGPRSLVVVPLIPPGQDPQLIHWPDGSFEQALYQALLHDGSTIDVNVRFTDSSSRRWHRSSNGELEPAVEPVVRAPMNSTKEDERA